MALKTWDDERVTDYDLNNNFIASSKILAVYTSTGFDSSQSTAGTGTANYETALITAASLGNADYIRIKLTITSASEGTFGEAGTASLKVEEKYNGGAYGTVFDVTANSVSYGGSGGVHTRTNTHTIEYLYTLTANDKANGIYFKITSTSVSAGNNSGASVANVCTIIETAA